MTVMFCDLVGSTELSSRMDPEELREVLRAYHRVCAEVVAELDGFIAKLIGDGLLVYFGYPRAHEDDARRAVRAGLRIAAGIRDLESTAVPHHEIDLAVRIGIHTGLVVVGELSSGDTREAAAIVGDTPNLAARLEGAAPAGGVLISQATFRLVEGLYTCEAMETLDLKGIAEPVTAYRVIGGSDAQTRFEAGAQRGLSEIVGREEEVGLLDKRWQQALDGERQLVLLSGEAGIGKSRVIRGLRDRLAGQDHSRVLYYGSPYHRHSAYFTVIDQLQRSLRVDPDDPVDMKRAALRRVLGNLQLPLEEFETPLATLLSLDEGGGAQSAEVLRARITRALIAVTEAMARQKPVLVVIEDTHYLDPSSLEFIDLLIRHGGSARLLVIAAFRPEMEHHWTSYPHATMLTLNRLSRRDTAAMIGVVLRDKPVADEIVEQIAERTDGVPLFVEELARSMLDMGLVVESDGGFVLSRKRSSDVIPASLHDSLASRLDRLGPARSTAQLAATFGRTFSCELLAAISPLSDAELEAHLQQLLATDLINRLGTIGEHEFEFKHALVCDAAYQSLLKSDRRDAHRGIAETIAAGFPQIAESQPELLARHYTEAGMTAPAVDYWQRAGDMAVQRSANIEAISHFETGISHLLTLADSPKRARQEFAMQVALGSAYVMIRGVVAPEVERAFARARDLAPHVDDPKDRFNALWGHYYVFEIRADWAGALDNIPELTRLARHENDSGMMLQAHHAAWTASAMSGRLADTCRHVEEARSLYDVEAHHHHKFRYGGHDPGVCCHCVGSIAHLLRGDLTLGREYLDHALRLAGELGHPTTEMIACFFASVVQAFLREYDVAGELAAKTVGLGRKFDNVALIKMGTFMDGYATAVQQSGTDGIERMEKVLAPARKLKRTGFMQSVYFGLLADAHLRRDNHKAGRQALADAFYMAEAQSEGIWLAEMHRLQGEFALADPAGAGEDAITCFEQALRIAREQEARSMELRAAISLASPYADAGRREEAAALLARPLDALREHAPSLDILQAKDMLDALK